MYEVGEKTSGEVWVIVLVSLIRLTGWPNRVKLKKENSLLEIFFDVRNLEIK